MEPMELWWKVMIFCFSLIFRNFVVLGFQKKKIGKLLVLVLKLACAIFEISFLPICMYVCNKFQQICIHLTSSGLYVSCCSHQPADLNLMKHVSYLCFVLFSSLILSVLM